MKFCVRQLRQAENRWNAIPHTFQLQMYHTTTHTIHIIHQRLFIGMGGKCIAFIDKVVKRADNPIQAA
jgi:hypothetical protein